MKKNKILVAVCIILAIVIPVAILAACLAGGSGDDASDPSASVSYLSMPATDSGPASSAGLPPSEAPGQTEAPSEPEISSVLAKQPAPEFTETPAVSVSGLSVTVTFKTDVNATVNTILATSESAPNVTGFYDYFSRGQANSSAVSKAALYNVTSAGKSQTYTLPDLGRTYYLWINAVENATDTWQGRVTVVHLYKPDGATAPLFATTPYLQENTTDNYVFKVEMLMPSTVYALVTAQNGPTPTPTMIRDGTGYGGTVYQRANATTAAEAPFHTTLNIPKGGLAAGTYTVWFVAASTAFSEAPWSNVTSATMTI